VLATRTAAECIQQYEAPSQCQGLLIKRAPRLQQRVAGPHGKHDFAEKADGLEPVKAARTDASWSQQEPGPLRSAKARERFVPKRFRSAKVRLHGGDN